MKALVICPAIRPAVPRLAEDDPLVTIPLLGESLAGHWIEHLAVLGARRITVVAADRPGRVRAALGDGARWGVELTVLGAGAEPTRAEAGRLHRPPGEPGWLPAPHDVVCLNHLPGWADLPLFESYASWFAGVLAWLPHALTPARVRVREVSPGIYVSRRAHVSPQAQLLAPCWIGDQAFVGPGAIVGPAAIVEDRSVVDREVRVTYSWIGPDTFVGPLTAVASSLAWASRLTNWQTESSLRVLDPFLLCSLAPPPAGPAPGAFARAERPRGLAAAAPPSWAAGLPVPAGPGPPLRHPGLP